MLRLPSSIDAQAALKRTWTSRLSRSTDLQTLVSAVLITSSGTGLEHRLAALVRHIHVRTPDSPANSLFSFSLSLCYQRLGARLASLSHGKEKRLGYNLALPVAC